MANNLGNKEIMAENIQRYLDRKSVTKLQLSDAIGVPYSTIRDWLKARAYPRIDKIEKMANFFGCTKADLVEPADYSQPLELRVPYTKEWAELIDVLKNADAEDVARATKILQALNQVTGR